jgi:peptidoglycan/LPS O-acetylase OafA/YrhL
MQDSPTRYVKHVDGLRAIAVLSVIVFHLNSAWLPGGFAGVDVFFVISGFVVTASLAPHAHENWRQYILGFYQRRLTRIVPALLVTLSFTTIVYVLLIPRSWLSGQTQDVAALAFIGGSNWALATQSDAYFAPRAEFNPFTHTWSLGVEEQFYLVAPWLIFLALRPGRRAHTTAGIGCGLLFTLVSLVISGLWTNGQPLLAFYSIVSRFWELAAGALWYVLLWQSQPVPAAAQRFQGAMAPLGLVVLAEVLLRASPQAFPFPWAIGAVVATLMLIGLPTGQHQAVPTALGNRLLVWLGLRSYSLYLWHWPVFTLLRWTCGIEDTWTRVLALMLTLAAAHASYRWVEQPIRRSARWQKLPQWASCTALAGVSVAGALATFTAFDHQATWSLSTVTKHASDWYADHADPTLASTAPCITGPHYRTLDGVVMIEHKACEPDARRLFVLGDSHATGYLPMLHRLAVDERVSVTVYQVPGCPFLSLRAPMPEERPACIPTAKVALNDLLAHAQRGDAVFLPSLRLLRFVDQWGRLDEAEALASNHGAAATAGRTRALQDARQWLAPLEQRGLSIIVEAPKPIFRAPAFRCADPWTRANPICERGLVEAAADEVAYREPMLQAVEQLARQTVRASVFDPLPVLCPSRTCGATAANGRPLYFDADHLSRYGNEVVYPAFRSHWRTVVNAPGEDDSLKSIATGAQRAG